MDKTNKRKVLYYPIAPLIVTAVCSFSLGRLSQVLEVHSKNLRSIYDSSHINTTSFSSFHNYTNGGKESLENMDEADVIIHRSYQNSYLHILPCDDNITGMLCMKKTHDYFNTLPGRKDSQTTPPIPWWFQTLLRDLLKNGSYGHWHHFTTADPALQFCTIEKVGTTEWRKVFCDLNANDCKELPSKCQKGLPGRKCSWKTIRDIPSDAPWVVFLRDPLERLLSAYLDKCEKLIVRRVEKHCEPNIIFNPDPIHNKSTLELTMDLEDKKKQMFAAYLDVMPLKWNVHFVPQAIICDLHRTIKTKYAFIGNMGRNFMADLEKMADKFGGRLPYHLDKIFNYTTHLGENRVNNTGSSSRHSTHSPEKVQQFYTAQTVRKALEYLSIDYVTLGLEVPEWARQMLRDETI